MISRWLSWIFLLPVALVIIAFSVSNRDTVILNLWPLNASSPPLPVFGIVLVGIFGGVLVGRILAWAAAGRLRRRIRNLTYRADEAERQVVLLRKEIDNFKSAQKKREIAISSPPNAKAA